MHYSAIKYNDIANGTGVRTVLFVSGCRNHCKECFQPETWDFKNGEEFTKENAIQTTTSKDDGSFSFAKVPYGLTLLGGDPFEPENQHALLPFIKRVRTEHPEKDIWAYTGYVLDKDLVPEGRRYTEDTKELLSLIDVLVDGPYVAELYDITLKFKGSSNQRVINVPATLREGKIVLHCAN